MVVYIIIIVVAAILLIFSLIVIVSNRGGNSNNNLVHNNIAYPAGVYHMDNLKIGTPYENLGEALKAMIREHKTADDIDFKAIHSEVQNVQDESTKYFFESMLSPLLFRRDYAQLDRLKERRERYNSEINVMNGESVLFKNRSISLYTVQKLFTEVSYGLARTAQGAFRAGAGTIRSHQVTGLKMKSNGTLYITNKRMIYIADTNETTVVNIGQIIEAIMYENDGILIKRANANPIVFNFNANFTYDSNNWLLDDSRLEAFNVIDSLIHD